MKGNMKLITTVMATSIAIMLNGCGGGGGSSNGGTQVTTPPSTATRTTLYAGYFGADSETVRTTAGHTNILLVLDWGDTANRPAIQSRILDQLNQCKAAGIKAVLGISYILFEKNQSRGSVADTELRALLNLVKAQGYTDTLIGLYPMDEPDGTGINVNTLVASINAAKVVTREYPEFTNLKWVVIYGDHGTPGIEVFDWVSTDRYGLGQGQVSIVDALPLTGNQLRFYTIGGADRYRNDPRPFLAAAIQNKSVTALVFFLDVDYVDPDGIPQKGIRNNGMQPLFVEVGTQIKSMSP